MSIILALQSGQQRVPFQHKSLVDTYLGVRFLDMSPDGALLYKLATAVKARVRVFRVAHHVADKATVHQKILVTHRTHGLATRKLTLGPQISFQLAALLQEDLEGSGALVLLSEVPLDVCFLDKVYLAEVALEGTLYGLGTFQIISQHRPWTRAVKDTALLDGETGMHQLTGMLQPNVSLDT